MELRHLRYFVRTAELLHFTRAAESLFISQPTLSAHIQQLEEELGCELFARIGRKVQLTDAGNILLQHARKALSEVESATTEIDASNGLLRGTLAIAASPAWSSRLLPGWITAFSTIHPEVRIIARSGSSEDLEAGVLSGELAIAFSYVPTAHHEITNIDLMKDDVVAVMHKTHPLAKKHQLAPEDLHRLPVASSSHRIAIFSLVNKYFEDLRIDPQVMIQYDDGLALQEIVKLSTLATILPRTCVKPDDELAIVQLPPPGITITLGALITHRSPAINAFLDVVHESVKVLQENALKRA